MIKKVLICMCAVFLFVSLNGCESLVKKFVRKNKKEKNKAVEMVLIPEEYNAPNVSKEEFYRKQFLMWQNWHDELYQALNYSSNRKKTLDCANEAIKYLNVLKNLLKQEDDKKVEDFIQQMESVKEDIQKDIYGYDKIIIVRKVERIRTNINKDLSYHNVEGLLK